MGTSFMTTCARCNASICARDKKRGQVNYFCSRTCRDAARREGAMIPCEACGTLVYRKPSKRTPHTFCSQACSNTVVGSLTSAAQPKGEDRWNWKGGVTFRDGYRFLRRPDHPNANASGYVAEHRLIMSEKIGRPLRQEEYVHHIDGNKLNNEPTNLLIVRAVDHSRAHRLLKVLGRRGWDNYPAGCLDCGTTECAYGGKGLCERCYGRIKQREYAARRRALT